MKSKKKLKKCTQNTKKKSKQRSKQGSKEEAKPSYDPNPTYDLWARQDYIKRRTNWMWRLRPFLIEKNKKECGTCEFGGRCHRIPTNEKITKQIAKGKGCPDFKSVWKKILSDKGKFDWGF